MKKLRSICGKVLLVCMALLLLPGCSASGKKQEEPFVLTAENSMEITLVNASSYPAKSFDVHLDARQEWFDLLQDLGRNMEPGEILTTRIPKEENNCYSFCSWADEDEVGYALCLSSGYLEYIPEGGIIVLPPDNAYFGIQTIFEAGTDVETARETTLSQYQAAYDAKLEAQRAEEEAAKKAAEEEEKRREEEEKRLEEEAKRLEEEKRQEKEKWARLANLSQEEIDEAVKLLGYDSLADMRTKENPDIMFRDFGDEWEMLEHDAYYQLYGYWYPNGDRNSLTYIAITDGEFMWYQFDPEQGDVQMGKLRLAAASGGRYLCTFTLADGNKFTVERTSVFHDLSQGTLTFEDCTKEYSDNVEYYYSRY